MMRGISLVIAGVVFGSILTLGFLSFQDEDNTNFDDSTLSKAAVAASSTIPQLNLPIAYFSRETLHGWSGGTDYTQADKATFAGGYRSFPTTTVTFTDFNNDHEEITEVPEGELGDVTGDGVPELLVAVDTGGNHPPHKYQIIRGSEIIFTGGSNTLLLEDLTADPTGNGFTLSWVADQHVAGRGLCCNAGHINTRFVFEDRVFKPIYEQEEIYFEVTRE